MFHFFIAFQKAFRSPDYDFNVNVSRMVIGLFMLYKLLSRDFGLYGYLPDAFFSFYPAELYEASANMKWTGIPVLTEIFTMHWVHWLLPRPNAEILQITQGTTIFFLLLFTFYGVGPKKCFCIASLLGLLYLWGHLVLSGQEVDSVAMYFGMILVFAFSKHRDAPIWKFKHVFSMPPNKQAGFSRSLIIFVLACYYFASGFNKITDILVVDIFSSTLNLAIQNFYILERLRNAAGP